MTKTKKISKRSVVSVRKSNLGSKKKGKSKNGTKRWLKLSNNKSKSKKSKNTESIISKRLKALKKDQESVWGKNKLLEKFWQKLASGKEAVIIYTNGIHKITVLPSERKSRFVKFNEFDNNPEIKAVLISNQSTDSYELLYKKAKNKKVNEVIKNYKTYFKSSGITPPDLIQQGFPLMKKVLYPY